MSAPIVSRFSEEGGTTIGIISSHRSDMTTTGRSGSDRHLRRDPTIGIRHAWDPGNSGRDSSTCRRQLTSRHRALL
jgi:hypothetical protein